MHDKIDKGKIKKLVCFFLFLILVWKVFVSLTYLFRSAESERMGIMAFYEEKANSLDVVLVGGSNIVFYWDPMQMWDKCGITSYNYAVPAMPAALFTASIHEIYKTQTPKVIIVDVRNFFSDIWVTEIGGGFRNVIDAMDISFDRFKYITDYCDLHHISKKSALPSYIDLIFYHTNHSVLKSRTQWGLCDNTLDDIQLKNRFKGFWTIGLSSSVAIFKDYSIPATEEEAGLLPDAERSFRELLEYCDRNGIPLLLVEGPYIITEQDVKESNTISRIAAEYGVPFLNANDMDAWAQMGIDPLSDFYNEPHVNVLGTEKYTDFLSGYINENYTLPDHRGEEKYDSWQILYDNEYMPHIEDLRKLASTSAFVKRQALSDEERMKSIGSPAEWLALADDPNMTLLIEMFSSLERLPTTAESLMLKNFGFSFDLDDVEKFIGIYSGTVRQASTSLMQYDYMIPSPPGCADIPCSLSVGDDPGVTVNDVRYYPKQEKGIHIIVVDNNTAEVVDSVILDVSSAGDLTIEHTEISAP